MSAKFALAIALMGLVWAKAANADDLFGAIAPVTPQELNLNSGNTSLSNSSTTNQSNNDSPITLGDNAVKYSGSISEAHVTGNQGITAVMQNTGDLVNMSNTTSVNVYLQ